MRYIEPWFEIMLDYEICKKLKEEGFPQEIEGRPRMCDEVWFEDEEVLGEHYIGLREEGENYIKIPSLSELISVCGKNFYWLKRRAWGGQKDQWEAKSLDMKYGFGKDAEEAVANLWLNLYGKKFKSKTKK